MSEAPLTNRPMAPLWRGRASVIGAVLGCLFCAAPATAHKMEVFALAEGKTIRGEAYFRGGDPARHAKVTLIGPGGEVLGQTTTDDEGAFRFDVGVRCDYKVVVDAGDGHQEQCTVPADEFPDDLPGLEGGEHPSAAVPDDARPGPNAESETALPFEPGGDLPGAAGRPGLESSIESLARQVAALRKDVDRYRNELRLHDVLGGIGYILGLMGISFYFLGSRRKEIGSARKA